MMKSEFIEKTGFEPTPDEYAQIEHDYMGCDIDKDQFCKEWKKNGGIQRLTRMRARRIEELEYELETVRRIQKEKNMGIMDILVKELNNDLTEEQKKNGQKWYRLHSEQYQIVTTKDGKFHNYPKGGKR